MPPIGGIYISGICFVFDTSSKILVISLNIQSELSTTVSCRLLFYSLYKKSLLQAMGFKAVYWKDLVKYQTQVVSWAEDIVNQPGTNVSADTFKLQEV